MPEAKAVPICCPPAILTQDAQQSPSGPHWPRFLSAARGLPALPPRTICPFGKTPPSLCRPPSPPATGRSRASSAQGFCEGRAGAVGTGRLLRGHGRVRTHTSVSRGHVPPPRCEVCRGTRAWSHCMSATHRSLHPLRICVCDRPLLFSEYPRVSGSRRARRGRARAGPLGSPPGVRGHSPCRVSYCLICTSSTQSAGNQPVRPFTVPSQKPPSPMLSTGGTEARQAVRAEQGSRAPPPRSPGVPRPPLLLPSLLLLAFSLERFWDPHIREMNRWAQHRTGMWGTERHTDKRTRGETGHRGRGHSPAPAPPRATAKNRVIVLRLGTRPRGGPGRADPHDFLLRAPLDIQYPQDRTPMTENP